ncbi:MAG TPA: nitroreductase family protein [Rectinemataceae bacterium]|nr:nitroreductase family protein [Rectinemataceae bacterium]
MNETIKLLLGRKSIRDFADREVPRELRDQILQAMIRSPTAGNMMLYSVIEVEDPEARDTLVESCDRQRFIGRAPWVLLFLADYRRWMDYFGATGVEAMCREQGVEMERPLEGDLVLAMCDALIAAQTTAIAAESMGLGSTYVGDILQHAETHRALFALPRYTFPAALLCLGYPSEAARSVPQRPRFDLSHIVFKDRYRSCGEADFEAMSREVGGDAIHYRSGAANFGQHTYLKKFGTSFSREIRRAVRVWLGDWV